MVEVEDGAEQRESPAGRATRPPGPSIAPSDSKPAATPP